MDFHHFHQSPHSVRCSLCCLTPVSVRSVAKGLEKKKGGTCLTPLQLRVPKLVSHPSLIFFNEHVQNITDCTFTLTLACSFERKVSPESHSNLKDCCWGCVYVSFHKVIMADLEEGGWWSEQLETELVKKLNYIGSWRPVTVLFNCELLVLW